MNFKSILVLGLSVATLGLSLPAHADTANVVDSQQNAIVTGDGNDVRQQNTTNVENRRSGKRSPGSTGSAVTNGQSVDVMGNDNKLRQDNKTNVRNSQRNGN